METYTMGETPEEVILKQLPHKYPMELNRSDMLVVLRALKAVMWEEEDALNLRSSILETLLIEEV